MRKYKYFSGFKQKIGKFFMKNQFLTRKKGKFSIFFKIKGIFSKKNTEKT